MINVSQISSFIKNKLLYEFFSNIALLILINLNIYSKESISQCLNDILIFNNRNYSSGALSINNKGDLFLQLFSEDDNYRLFYGLRSNGRYYFTNESPICECKINNMDIQKHEGDIDKSKNLFISLNQQNNGDKQYLLSINSYGTIVELYDLDLNNNNAYSTKQYFDSSEPYYFSKFFLFDFKKQNTYLLIYAPIFADNSTIFLNDFRINSFNINHFYSVELTPQVLEMKYKTIDIIIMYDIEIIAYIHILGARYFCIHSLDYSLNRKSNHHLYDNQHNKILFS